MNTRHSAIAAVISSIFLLTACGGGAGNLSAAVPRAPAPTVIVTAPATATAGYAFTAGWTSTDATRCSAGDLSTITDPNASFSKTETDAGIKTYSVTCTGAGGSATGTAVVVVDSGPTAAGAWQGTTDDGRTLSGVVLPADTSSGSAVSSYWLAYTKPSDATPAGFVAGMGTSIVTSPTGGNFSSGDLREFNFAAGRVNADGTLTAAYVKQASLGTASAPGSWTDNDNVANPVFPIAYTVTSVAETPVNNEGAVPAVAVANSTLAGTASLASNGVLSMSVSGELRFDIAAFATTVDADPLAQSFQFKTTTNGAGTYNLVETATATNADDSFFETTSCSMGAASQGVGGDLCAFGPFSPLNTKSVLYSGNPAVPSFYSNQSFMYSGGTVKIKELLTGAGGALSLPYIVDYTLTRSGAPAPTTRTFNLAYSADYESTPDVATIAGSYTATPAYTGIDSAMYTNTTTFSISSDGTVSGAESTSGCSYSATIAPRTVGNVYDVTALIFTGGSCVYTSSGEFSGVAIYDAATRKVTLTALDSTHSQGFMAVASKP